MRRCGPAPGFINGLDLLVRPSGIHMAGLSLWCPVPAAAADTQHGGTGVMRQVDR